MGRTFKRDGVEYMFKPDGGIQKQTYGDTTDFKKKKERQEKAIEEAKTKPVTPDDGYLVDSSKLQRKPKPKYKAEGGRIEYKYGGGVGCAKRGFNKKILKKGKK